MQSGERRAWFLSVFEEWRDPLLQEAADARRHARNYRNFLVGAAALSYSTSTRSLRVAGGFNFMPRSSEAYVYADQATRMCAEPLAISLALQPVKSSSSNANATADEWDEGHVIVAVAVVGEPQMDAASEISSQTLHPCFQCRVFLQGCDQVSPNTIFLGATPGLSVQEVMRVDELIALHATHWTDAQRNLP
ncbi:MAG: hypothetical protein WD850_02335 [Candidatus Spechtbacterales bacterium]